MHLFRVTDPDTHCRWIVDNQYALSLLGDEVKRTWAVYDKKSQILPSYALSFRLNDSKICFIA